MRANDQSIEYYKGLYTDRTGNACRVHKVPGGFWHFYDDSNGLHFAAKTGDDLIDLIAVYLRGYSDGIDRANQDPDEYLKGE